MLHLKAESAKVSPARQVYLARGPLHVSLSMVPSLESSLSRLFILLIIYSGSYEKLLMHNELLSGK